jgi:hypothetical protein
MSDIEEMVTVFVVRCPLGDSCSKKNGILGKKLDEAEARQVAQTHLMQSPYHNLQEDAAIELANNLIVESWEEAAEAAKTDEGDDWFNSRKRGRMDQMTVADAREVLRRAQGSSSGSGSRGPRQLALAIGARNQHAKNITLPRAQLKACIDSLKRARLAAESAGGLCGRASRAFYEEAACITGCQDVLESYMAAE